MPSRRFAIACSRCVGSFALLLMSFSQLSGVTNPTQGVHIGDVTNQTPEATVVRNPFRPINMEYGLNPSAAGLATELSIDSHFTPEMFDIPLIQRGLAIEDTKLTIWPFSLELKRFRSAFLFTDNGERSRNGGEHDVIAISNLDMRLIFQPTEDFHIAIDGSLVYLPLKNAIGFDGFGLFDETRVRGAATSPRPIAQAQAYYRFHTDNWDIEIVDHFYARIDNGPYLFDYQIDGTLLAWDPVTFEEVDQAGRYQFRGRGFAKGSRTTGLEDDSKPEGDIRFDDLRRVNIFGVTAETMLPTETRFKVSLYNEDEWTDTRETDSTKHTNSYGGRILLANERENMRFKPFGYYKFVRSDEFPESGWEEQWAVGFRGPITDQVDFITHYGWERNYSNIESKLWRIALRHVAGPYTIHGVSYRRELGDQEVAKIFDYRISQVIGDGLTLDFIVRKREAERGINRDLKTKEWLYFASLVYRISKKSLLATNLSYEDRVFEGSGNNVQRIIFYENRLSHRMNDDWQFFLTYRWERRKGSENTRENMVLFEMIRDL